MNKAYYIILVLALGWIILYSIFDFTRYQKKFEYMNLNNEIGYSDYCFITKDIPICEIKGINIQVKRFKEND